MWAALQLLTVDYDSTSGGREELKAKFSQPSLSERERFCAKITMPSHLALSLDSFLSVIFPLLYLIELVYSAILIELVKTLTTELQGVSFKTSILRCNKNLRITLIKALKGVSFETFIPICFKIYE